MPTPLPPQYHWMLRDEEVQVTGIYASDAGTVVVRVDRSLVTEYEPALPGLTTAVITYIDDEVQIDGKMYDLGDDLMPLCGLADEITMGPHGVTIGVPVTSRNC